MTSRTERRAWPLAGPITRRTLLRGAGLAGAGLTGAVLIGCGDRRQAVTTGEPSPTAAAGDPYANIKRGGTLKISITQDPPTLDPYGHASFLTKTIAGFTYSRLFRIAARPDRDPSAVGIEPDVATSAETADGLVWVVKLKRGVRFHDVAPVKGRELVAEDVVESWKRLAGEKSPNRDLAAKTVSKIEAVDSQTIRFTLLKPTAVFLDMLADPSMLWIMPREASGQFDPKVTMIGSGPWLLGTYRVGSGFTFRRNPASVDQPKPFLDGIEVAMVPEYGTALAQFRSGALHLAPVSIEDAPGLRKEQPTVQWRGTLPALVSLISFEKEDTAPKAPWRDVRFRRAVSMLQDRAAQTELGYQIKRQQDAGLQPLTAWNNVLPAGMGRWWLDPRSAEMGPAAEYFTFNPAEARKLIDASGYTKERVPFIYPQNVYPAPFNAMAEATAAALRDGGLNVEVQPQDYNTEYVTQTFRSNFKGLSFGYESAFPEVSSYITRLFGEDAANHGRVHDKKIADLDEKQAVELNEEKRRGYLWEIQRINATQMYYVPSQAGAGTSWTAYRPEVRGLMQTRLYGAGTEVYPNLWLDA